MSSIGEKEVSVEFFIFVFGFLPLAHPLGRLTWFNSQTHWLLSTVWCQPINLFRLRFLHCQCVCQQPHIFIVALKLNSQTEKISRELILFGPPYQQPGL